MIHRAISLNEQDPKIGVLSNTPARPLHGEDIDYLADAEVEEQVNAVDNALDKLGFKHETFLLEEGVEVVVKALRDYTPDVVINLCEAAYGDSRLEMDVPSVLELLRLPYTGSPPLTLGLCQDKGLAKDILREKGIPTPKSQVLDRFEEWKDGMSYPLFVKPLREDASLGISKQSFVRNKQELKKQVEYVVRCYGQPALIEEYISGRELNIAFLGDEEPEILPISEIVFDSPDEPKIVDYAAKWLKDSREYRNTVPVCPAKIGERTRIKVEHTALYAYRALRCRDYARVDVRLNGRTPYVLEVNPNPDISPDAGYPRALEAAGKSYDEFIKSIISFALKRKGIISQQQGRDADTR